MSNTPEVVAEVPAYAGSFSPASPQEDARGWEEEQKGRSGLLARAEARAARIQEVLDGAAESRLRATARGAKAARMRVVWLQRAADVVGKAVEEAGGAACRKGCAHCCHIPVLLTTAEADEIARFSGKARVSHPAHGMKAFDIFESSAPQRLLEEARTAAEARYTGQACPFLRNDQTCGVYDVRPLACRLHFSLSDDEVPCRLSGTEGGQTGAEVVSLNVLPRRVDDAVTLGAGQLVADIRAWFEDRP